MTKNSIGVFSTSHMGLSSNFIFQVTNVKPILNPPSQSSSRQQFYNSLNRNLSPLVMAIRIFGMYFYPPTSAMSKHIKKRRQQNDTSKPNNTPVPEGKV